MTFRNIITIDLEDWYQGIEQPYTSWGRFETRLHIGLDRILGALDEANVKATFFVLGWIAEKHPKTIQQIAELGHEIASHGYNHEKLYDITPESFAQDIERAKGATEDAAGHPVTGYRAPYFSLTRRSLWAIDSLCRYGFTFDSSVYPGSNWRYGIPGSPQHPFLIGDSGLIEFPVSVFKLGPRQAGIGGAYFRILPLALTMRAIRKINKNGYPAMFYIHPWEFDPDHPFVRFRWRAMATHYFNLRATAGRFKRLLGKGQFATMSQALQDLQQAGMLPKFALS